MKEKKEKQSFRGYRSVCAVLAVSLFWMSGALSYKSEALSEEWKDGGASGSSQTELMEWYEEFRNEPGDHVFRLTSDISLTGVKLGQSSGSMTIETGGNTVYIAGSEKDKGGFYRDENTVRLANRNLRIAGTGAEEGLFCMAANVENCYDGILAIDDGVLEVSSGAAVNLGRQSDNFDMTGGTIIARGPSGVGITGSSAEDKAKLNLKCAKILTYDGAAAIDFAGDVNLFLCRVTGPISVGGFFGVDASDVEREQVMAAEVRYMPWLVDYDCYDSYEKDQAVSVAVGADLDAVQAELPQSVSLCVTDEEYGDETQVRFAVEWDQEALSRVETSSTGTAVITGKLVSDISEEMLRIDGEGTPKLTVAVREPAAVGDFKLTPDFHMSAYYPIFTFTYPHGARTVYIQSSEDGVTWKPDGLNEDEEDYYVGDILQQFQTNGGRIVKDGVARVPIYARYWVLEQEKRTYYRLHVEGSTYEGNSNVVSFPEEGWEGDEAPSGNGGSEGKRGGGGRDSAGSAINKSLTTKELGTLLKANPDGTNFVIDGIKLWVSASELTSLSGGKTKPLSFEAQKLSADRIRIGVKAEGKEVASFRDPFLVRFDYLGGRGKDYVIGDSSGGIIATGFYDEQAREMIFQAAKPGEYQVKQAKKKKFTDTGNHWGAASIDFLSARSILTGLGDGTFQPGRAVTGSEFLRMLNIAQGGKGTMVTAGSAISRERAAMLLYGALGGKDSARGPAVAGTYLDGDKVDPDKLQAVLFVQREGLMTGKGNGSFDPKGTLTRAEAAVIIERLIKKERV